MKEASARLLLLRLQFLLGHRHPVADGACAMLQGSDVPGASLPGHLSGMHLRKMCEDSEGRRRCRCVVWPCSWLDLAACVLVLRASSVCGSEAGSFFLCVWCNFGWGEDGGKPLHAATVNEPAGLS